MRSVGKKLLYILVPLFVLLILASQVDDDLSKEATDFIGRVNTKSTSDSYLYLHGIFASEAEDPIAVGNRILDEQQKFDLDASYNVSEYPDAEKIALPDGEEFCKTWEDGCLSYLFSSTIHTKTLLNEHRVLVARSNQFLDFEEYVSISKPTVHEKIPPYQYISSAERIKVLEAISAYKNGKTDNAIDSLSLQFSSLRNSMEMQDTLIGKMVFLINLSEVIDVLSIILSVENLRSEAIPALTQSEKSFYLIAAREFALSYNTFKDLDKHPEFFEMGQNLPGWITRIVFKPNMTANAVAPVYVRLEHLSQLSPDEFAQNIETQEVFTPSTSRLRNYIGNALVKASPNFDEYVARFHDFDVKLALFNQIYHFQREPENMENPYYKNEIPEKSAGKLCFNGPLEDTRSLRCLTIKI